ncbi:MAG TPA: thioredoxin family protein [Thermoanaerobaculia bacterium]|nr:thioredoxin family protein [Thermoanaerobaculia bacterium]
MKKVLVALSLMLATAAFADELAVGARAPAFSLVNATDGKSVAMKPDDGRLKVVVFTCNQCPYAKAFEPRLIEIASRFAGKGVSFYAVNPNDEAKFAEESLDNMKARAAAKDYPFPYLKDGDSSIARAYGARVTPHVFVVDGSGVVRYRGYVDDSAKPEERKTTGLTDALNALINGRDVQTAETRAFGCTIKWKG